MTQDLFIKDTDPKTGKSSMKKVTIIRSWQDASGKQLYLHMNGTYGYKDGSPVKTAHELDELIHDKHQAAAAKAWWERTGKALAEQFYVEKDKQDEERQRRLTPVQGDLSELDTAVYTRRPVNDRRKNAWSGPGTWVTWFTARPEWWGLATTIEIQGYRYKLVEPESEISVSGDEEPPEEPSEMTPAEDEQEEGATATSF